MPELAYGRQVAVSWVKLISQPIVGRAAYGVFGFGIGVTGILIFYTILIEDGVRQ